MKVIYFICLLTSSILLTSCEGNKINNTDDGAENNNTAVQRPSPNSEGDNAGADNNNTAVQPPPPTNKSDNTDAGADNNNTAVQPPPQTNQSDNNIVIVTPSNYTLCDITVDNTIYNSTGTDPLIDYQWYLNDVGIKDAWAMNNKQGAGIEVSVVDDALQLDHEDLAANVIFNGSINVHATANDPNRNNPYPRDCSADGHGTASAGIIAAAGDNGRGIKGVAPNVTIWGSNLINTNSYNNKMMMATYSHRVNTTAISSNSWGPTVNRFATKIPGFYELLDHGLSHGFDGKGISYVFAAGNSRDIRDVNGNVISHDMASNWEVTNHRGVIVVCAVGTDGLLSTYSEPGVNLWVCAPSNVGARSIAEEANTIQKLAAPSSLLQLGVTTLDLSGTAGYNNLTENDYVSLVDTHDPHNNTLCGNFLANIFYNTFQFARPGFLISQPGICKDMGMEFLRASLDWSPGTTNSYNRFFSGTSAATPMVSGIIALIRSAYPELTWREIKLILAESASKPGVPFSAANMGAAAYNNPLHRYTHHIDYGFGVVYARAAMELASKWRERPLLPTERKYESPPNKNDRWYAVDNQAAPPITVPDDSGISFIEHVYIDIGSNIYPNVAELNINVTSPSGATSILSREHTCLSYTKINSRSVNPVAANFCPGLINGFIFGSAMHLGENPAGVWRLSVTDSSGADVPGIGWKLSIYGH